MPAVIAGTVGWLVALVVLLAVGNHSWWMWVAAAGLGLGVVGLPIMARYQRVHG